VHPPPAHSPHDSQHTLTHPLPPPPPSPLPSTPFPPAPPPLPQVKSYLAGNPPIRIKLNDGLLISSRDTGGGGGLMGGYGSGFSAGDYASDSGLVVLDDVYFHEVGVRGVWVCGCGGGVRVVVGGGQGGISNEGVGSGEDWGRARWHPTRGRVRGREVGGTNGGAGRWWTTRPLQEVGVGPWWGTRGGEEEEKGARERAWHASWLYPCFHPSSWGC
jgi:hypothetical protein